MESGNGGASNKGVLVPVSASSDVFQKSILAPLKSAYLYEESKQCFRYKSAVFVKNPALEEKYNAFRAKRREVGYSEEDLEESYGFLLFDDVSKANALGETGVLTGNSTCTTLGDPSQGVYISMYSDCLDLNRWYHGKSGYIAIIRLTKGRVKKVLENYTQNFTAPTEGFDCHVSEQLPSVSANTSSFLAFERTQYYMYELLDDGSNGTARSPSAACPFAIVSFSYADTKTTLAAPHEKSEDKKQVFHYFPWRGQLQIGTQFYFVGLRSTAGALMPTELPPVVKVDRTISMSDLRQLLPRAVFDTCFTGEVFLDGLYCSWCELVSSEAKEASSLPQLLKEIKEKDVALTITLKDGGFLILLHSSHFLTYDDCGSGATEILHGIFVFPDSRVIQRDTKFGERKPGISSEILRVLPVLTYAEGEVEKTHIDPSEDLCDVLAHHMQSYAALINPGLELSPSREVSIFPDQYDVPDAYKHLYSSPEWSNRAWQSFRSYLSKPLSFQMSVSKVSEILAAGQQERIEDLDDDVYICLSSPEEAPVSDVNIDSEDQLTGQKSPVTAETSVDSYITSTEAQGDLPAVPQNIAPDLQTGNDASDTEMSDLTVPLKTDMGTKNLLSPSTSDDLPAELIVSITSAERTVTSVISTESATKHDFQLCGFSSPKLQTAGVTSHNDDTVLDCPEVTNLTKTKCRKLRRGRSKGSKKVSETLNVQTVKIPVEDENLKREKEDQAKEPSGQTQLSEPSNTDWRKARRRKRKFGKLSSKIKKVRCDTVGLAVAEEKRSHPGQHSCLMELESCPLRKKTERWDLKPVISECGKILVPHGCLDFDDQIKSLKDKHQYTKNEHSVEKMLADASVNTIAHDPVKIGQESITAPELAVNETEAATSKDEGNLLQTVVVRHINPDCSILRQSDDGSGSVTLNPESNEHSSKNDGADTPSSEADQEKHTDTLSPGKCATKGEFLLRKLKSVLLRGKRKPGLSLSEKTAAETAQDAEPCLKRGKVDSGTGMLKSNDAITSVQNTDVGINEVSKTLSVDPLFAYALGLTPKETLAKVQKTEGQDTQQRKDLPETQEQTFLDKQPQIIQKPPSIFPRRGRIKTLKKHQGISAEHVKQKWWLHFQSPACFASEKLKFKECTRDKSVRKTVKEKMNSACSSTDALNLLADLALASNNQVPRQPDPALERKPETSLKTCDLTNDVTSAEQQSVLHSLLRQPATRPIQPLESPSPTHLVGGSELVALVSKEHAYSLPPSSSLLLGLSGTPFQVSPLSGSTRLLHHHQTMYGDGIKTLHLSVSRGDRREHNHRTPEYLTKHMIRRRKFRHSRTFVNIDGSIQVTKQWKENYDFNLDSKFSSDPRDKAIIRALHGPWDFSIQDTTEEVRLIVHMWIGLFYSRSTARFFHIDPSLTNPSSEESDSFEMPSGMISAPAQPELKANPVAPFPSVTDTSDPSISRAMDLSKKDDSILDHGSVILDLSLKTTNAEISTSDVPGNRKETSVSSVWKDAVETLNALKSSVELPEASTSQCFKMECSTVMTSEMNDVKSTHENEITCAPLQKGGHLVHTDIPSLKGDGTTISVQEHTKSGSVQQRNHQTASGIGHSLQEINSEKREMTDGMEKSETTNIMLVHKHRRDSTKSLTDEVVGKGGGDVVHTLEQDETESKDGKNWEVKEKPCQEGNIDLSPKISHTGDDSRNKDSSVVCNGNLSENEMHLSREKPKAVSPGKAENDEDVDCCRGDDSSNKLSGLVCNENPLENKAQLSGEETKAVSPGKTENIDLNCCTLRENQIEDDHLEKEAELERNSFVSAVEADSDFCDDAAKQDCITESNHQAPLEAEPSQGENEVHVCHDVQLRKRCANGSALTDEHAVSEKNPSSSTSEMEPIYDDTCLADKAHYQKTALPISSESACDGSVPQTNGGIETGSQNKVIANCNPSCDVHEEQKVDNTTQNGLFHQQPLSHQFEAMKRCEDELMLNKQTDLGGDKTNEALEKIHCGVLIPFIGKDISAEDTLQPHDSYSQGNVEEAIEGLKEIPFISDPTCLETLPIETCSTAQTYSKKAELPAGKISLSVFDENGTNQPDVLGSESDDQCPTPTMDEKPFDFLNCSGRSSNISNSSAFTGSEKDEILHKPKLHHKSTVNSDPYPHLGLQPDLELRTLRVLQSIDKFLSKSSHTDDSSQTGTASMKRTPNKAHNPSIKYIPTCLASSHTSVDFKDKKVSNIIPAIVSPSTSQEVHTESTGHFLVSPFSKLEEVLGVKLQLKKTDSSVHQHYFERTDKEVSIGQDYCYHYSSFPPAESLKASKPNVDQDRHKTTSQTNLSNEPRSYSQRPVMAVRPSKSDEIQVGDIAKGREIENSLISVYLKNNQTKTPLVTNTTSASKPLEKKTESLRGNSEGLNDYKEEANEPSSKSSWLSNDSESNSDMVKHWYDGVDSQSCGISKFHKIPSSFPAQSLESEKTPSKLADGSQDFFANRLFEKVGQTTKERTEMDQTNCSDTSSSVVAYKDISMIDDSLYLGPQSSLTCTVYNTNEKRSDSFMEQLSQRCIQDDLTQVSMERECLIFSEQMKQLLKRSKRGPICQLDRHDTLSCTSPVTVHFSSLEEQEDSVDHLDAPSLVGQKIKVDMTDRKEQEDATEEQKTLNPQKLGNPIEHAGVSSVTAECASLYRAMMNDVCASKKVPSRPKHLVMDIGYPKTEPSNHFDFCDEMKREMDENFRSNLNSVVKKSCKTKYRFYILVTSEDAFFEETKAQLEAEGHCAVQPSEFFIGEDSSSSLLIILRNEDIAEHICEVPHLLKLKNSPGVQFAGIDEPDDVVNLTHQELFMRGGFIMFDRAALESLSVCDMKKMTDILQELSRMGKWKWMLHYRDSRRLKENARLSAEAEEKKNFLNWCQEAGILEVLPYHECDLMSRDQPDYLTCLVRLQVQNISARYPVFITDTTTDGAFGKNGILTMTFSSFLTCSPSETFTV